MMIKYRVHEVAKDLNVPNKVIIDLLQKYCNETKKHMTALTEKELDIVFESFTQKHSFENLDAYFADNAPRVREQQPAPAKEEKHTQGEKHAQDGAPKSAPSAQKQPAARQNQPRKAVKPGKITPVSG
ncbi:MAG TPA: translation initiation factor IF-2, partial [Ruminococcaceae bacterium]|nr:translation initiation factor IF-2 [Oscillospiraceae bacterium]